VPRPSKIRSLDGGKRFTVGRPDREARLRHEMLAGHPAGRPGIDVVPGGEALATDVPSRLFESLDAGDSGSVASLFSPYAIAVLGNADPIVGRDRIEAAARASLTLGKFTHRITEQWCIGLATIVELDVSVVPLHGDHVTVPAIAILSAGEHGQIEEYRIVGDLRPIIACIHPVSTSPV
jgi:hypothetical protein